MLVYAGAFKQQYNTRKFLSRLNLKFLPGHSFNSVSRHVEVHIISQHECFLVVELLAL